MTESSSSAPTPPGAPQPAAPSTAAPAHGHGAEVAVAGPPLDLVSWLKTGTARKYVGIFGWLVVLTVVEIAATQMGMEKRVLAGVLIGTAVIKATVVALYFMHLRHEVRLILGVVIIPVVIAIVFLLILFPDIVIGPRSALQ